MVAANERRPYYTTVVLLSVAGSHSPLILCIAVTYLDPECCKLKKKKIKVRSGFIAQLHNKSYWNAQQSYAITDFSCRQITNSCSRISENEEISSYFNCKNANSVMVIHGTQHTPQFMRHELSTYFIKLSISNQGFSMYISIYNYEVK